MSNLTVSERLRDAIKQSKLSRYAISARTGIEQSTLSRFMHRERGLSQDAIDRLAEFFGLELRPVKRGKRGRP